MTVLIDSWGWIEYNRGTPAGSAVKDLLEGDEPIIFSAINLAEVYRWILFHKGPQAAEEMRSFMMAAGFMIPVDEETAILAANLKVSLKMGLADALGLATARGQHARLFTGDQGFPLDPDVIIWK